MANTLAGPAEIEKFISDIKKNLEKALSKSAVADALESSLKPLLDSGDITQQMYDKFVKKKPTSFKKIKDRISTVSHGCGSYTSSRNC